MLGVTKFARPIDTRYVRRRRCFGVLRWPPAPLNADVGRTCLYTCPGVQAHEHAQKHTSVRVRVVVKCILLILNG